MHRHKICRYGHTYIDEDFIERENTLAGYLCMTHADVYEVVQDTNTQCVYTVPQFPAHALLSVYVHADTRTWKYTWVFQYVNTPVFLSIRATLLLYGVEKGWRHC